VPGRIVLFGATGYTGELTARALAGRGAAPVLAGRSPAKLDALASELGGLDTQVADVADPASVRALVERGDVLVSTVGPFARFGEPAVQAAITGGAHYIDSAGETPFIRQVFERHGRGAEAAGCGLLTAFGGDWVPGNLAGALALRDAGDAATRVEIAYYATGSGMGGDGMSGGTRASAAATLIDSGYTFRGGRLATERNAARVKSFETRPGRSKPAISVGTSEHFALPRLAPGLREVDVYLGWFGPASRALQAFSVAGAVATRIPGVKGAANALAGRFVKGSSGGPDAEARAATGTLVLASAYGPGGDELGHVRLEGANGYDFTAAMLAWGAEQAAAGALKGTGALGPVDGFGLDELERGVAEAGIARA
jgi:short subunit dehydrogenase-like uncharacterized protein